MENFSLEYLGLIVTIGDCARQVNCWDLASLPKQSGMKRDRSHDRQVLNKNPGWKWKIHRNIRTQTVYGPTSWHSFTYHGHVNTAFLCIVGPRLCQTCCRVPSHPIVTDAHMFPFSWRYSSALLNLAQQWQKKKIPFDHFHLAPDSQHWPGYYNRDGVSLPARPGKKNDLHVVKAWALSCPQCSALIFI